MEHSSSADHGGLAAALHTVSFSDLDSLREGLRDTLRLQVRLGDALHAGRRAYMDSPLGAPGGLGGSLLVQRCFVV
jgi:hypothetical protein